MNWKEIKEKYPKAYILCEKEMTDGSYIEPFYETVNWNDRNLYDFFDKQGIYVNISSDCGKFFYMLYEYHEKPFKDETVLDIGMDEDKQFEIREEAETAAFIKAFEILEKNII